MIKLNKVFANTAKLSQLGDVALVFAIMMFGVNPLAYAQTELSSTDLFEMNIEALLKVNITGSHIRRSDTSDYGIVSIIDRDAIQRSGATSLEILLQRMPFSAGYAGNQTDAYWADSYGSGSTHVNLRGLGVNRTLVLLNGRRLAYGGIGANAAVDLNIIPLALIERIEILKDGASAIYGADAVAGVVNIITRKSLKGSEATVRWGETIQHDGSNYAADLVWGQTDERRSLILGINHSGNSAANYAVRAPCALGESGGRLICVDSGNTIGGRALLADGQRVNFNQVLGGDYRFFETYSATKHNFNANPYLNAVNPIERTSLSGLASFKLDEQLTSFAELLYTQRHSTQIASPGTLGLNRAINIAANYPGNPTGQSLLLQRRRLLEAGVRDQYQDVTSIDAVFGLEGKWEKTWDWSIAFGWRRNSDTDGSSNIANLDRVDQTLNTSMCSNAPGALIPCANYLGYGNVTKAVLDYIMFNTRSEGGNEQKSLSASLNGQPFELPAGPVAMAMGAEIRQEKGWRAPDRLIALGIANGNRQDPVSGSYLAREAFAEIVLPLFADLPAAKSLVLNSAVRASDYDLFGRTINYKMGLNWKVVPAFQLRTNFGTAFRAPNIPELFGGITKANLVTVDPCSGWSTLPASSVVRQNCQTAQVPVGYQQIASSILTTTGGNRNLTPEKAKTFTAGAVWEPDSALRFALDYYDITIKNAIGSVNGASKLASCYNSVGLSNIFCTSTHFTRNQNTGDIDFLSTQLMNEASERMTGIDLAMQYKFTVADWLANLNWQTSDLRRYDLLPYTGATETQLAGKITSGRGSYTHWRSFAALTLERGPWSGVYSLQYIGAADDITAVPGNIGAHAPGVSYHNVQLQYALNKSLHLMFGIDNLFNRSAPFIKGWLDVNTDVMTYDVSGRRWYAKVAYHW